MLTRTIITASSSSSEKVRYYTEDESVVEYYDADPEQSIGGDSIWLGELAKELGLSGVVQKDDLTAMMFGQSPDGTAIRWNKQRDDQEQRLVLDACLSPPKSWSIGALVCGEDLLIQLHQEAVAEVIQFLEERHAAARIQISGNRESIYTRNLAVAALTHYTARPVKELDESLKVDPQLHTHILIMNGTHCPDETYRALHTEALCTAVGIDNIYKNKLAQKAVKHGFKIRNTANGFELAAISDELIEAYSSRRNLAKALCHKRGLELSPDNIERMTLRSRMAKKLPKTLDEMRSEWAEQGKDLGIDGIPRDENACIEGLSPREMLESAIRHYSERSTSFTKEEIELYVFQHPQTFSEKELGREIFCHPNLIPVGKRYTTHTALNREKAILSQWFTGQQQAQAFAPQGIALEHKLNDRQRAVVDATLRSQDRDQIWQGISGAGKTRSLGTLKQELDLHHVKVRGFAPGIQEAKELARELEIDTNTVASLVLKEKGFGEKELWIIDEAGKLSTQQLKVIQDKAERTGSRLLLVGDKDQNAAIEAGSPFRQLQRYGATTHKLDKIIRQKNEVQKKAVELIANGDALESLNLLCEHGYVNEIQDNDLKVAQIAKDYLSLSKTQRAKTLVVSGTNAEAQAITTHIRQGLRDEGLIGEDVETKHIVSRQLSTEQKQQLHNYRPGDLLRLHRNNPSTPLKVGELYKVKAIHKNELTLINPQGKQYRFSPKRYKNIEVYHTQKLQIAAGDRLRWTHTKRKQGQINGAVVDVLAIKEAMVEGQSSFIATLRSQSGKITTLDLTAPVDLSHNLVSTSYRAQGQSKDQVIMSATADPTSMREAFYVAISRQKWFLKIYTQDIGKIENFITQSNTQVNALELINEQRRTEAQRYRGAIESLGGHRHQHPFIYSAVTSLAAGAIRKHADQRLIRRELERLYQQLERTHRRIKRLNGHLSGQNRPIESQRLAYIQDYQSIEQEFNAFLNQFEQEIRQNFGSELEEIIENYDWEDFELDPTPLGEYCPVDLPLPELFIPTTIETQTQLSTLEPEQAIAHSFAQARDISSDIIMGPASIQSELSRFNLVQVTQPKSDWLEHVIVKGESAHRYKPQMVWFHEQSFEALNGIDQVGFNPVIETQSHVPVQRLSSQDQDKPRSPLEELHHAPAPYIETLQTFSELREFLNISTEQANRQPQLFISSLVDFEAAVLEAEKLSINPSFQLEDSNITIESIQESSLQPIEASLYPTEPQLFAMPQVAFKTSIVEVDERGITHLVQIESGKSKVSDIIIEIWAEDIAVLTLNHIESTPTLHPAASKPQLLNLGTKDFYFERYINDELIFSQAHHQASQVVQPAIASRPFIEANLEVFQVDELERIPTNQLALDPQDNFTIDTKPCRFIGDRNNRNEMDLELNPVHAPIFDLPIQFQSRVFDHAYDSNPSHQRAVNDGDRELETLDPTVRTTNRTKRFSNPEPFNSERLEPLHGESHQQRETSTIQSIGDGHRLEEVNRAGYGRGLGESQPYPRQWQLNHGQSAIPQSDHDRNRRDTNPADSGAEHSERDWTDSLAEYRVLKEIATPLREVVNALQRLQDAKEELRQARLMRVVPKPIQIPVFWQPKYNDRDRPEGISPKDWEEFKASAIHPDLIQDNIKSIQGIPVMSRLLQDRLAKMGSGQFPTKKMNRLMNRYQALADAGGWWGTAGVDPFNHWKPSTWGCFKGYQPRLDDDGEVIKYENPLGVERQFYLPHIRDDLATRILIKHGIHFHSGDSFWKIVHEQNLPITYIEGYKKALAALSQGEIAIGVSGVNALYIANEKVNGKKFKLSERKLTPPAQLWATPGRTIKFAFDQDTKITAILNVRRDMVRAIELHPENDCKVVNWDASQGKGIDDLIVQSGPRAFTRAMNRAIPADHAIKAHYRYQYNRLKKQGFSDPQIWLKACRDNDIKDGDRYLAQSDFVRKNPAKLADYIKQQKIIALQAMKRASNKTVSRKRITTKRTNR